VQCFTAIVGPNGSGKSNVIDALLFVFGKRAKQLRQDKVSELLHFSENHQNIQSAKVSVYFHEIIDRVPPHTSHLFERQDLPLCAHA
jgi:structural maintenance of chromosome 4